LNSRPTILIVKESRQGEKRVSLVPADAYKLIQDNFIVLVEDMAGEEAGYSNRSYELVGAQIRKVQPKDSIEYYHSIFKDVDIIIRVKRPSRVREKLENLAVTPGIKMVGSLDILERNSNHLKEYHDRGINYYSFDQFYFLPNTPMDALKKMSFFAGRLSIEDAVKKINRVVEKVVVISYGKVGQAAYAECVKRKLDCTVITSQQQKADLITFKGGNAVYLSRETPLNARQENIRKIIKDADIVITAASSNGVIAPILIPNESLSEMKPKSIIIDLAVPEGGNVEGSRPDATLILGNNVYVKNISGYPKKNPVESSFEWSKASYYFINLLVKTPELLKRR